MKVKIYHNKNFLNGRKIQLQQEEIHIWCIRWGEIIDFLKEKAYIMDCQEKEKAAQYRFYEDRMRYMAGNMNLESGRCVIWHLLLKMRRVLFIYHWTC